MSTNFNLSIRNWRYSEIKAEIAVAKSLLTNAKTYTDKLGYIKLYRKDNPELFTSLTKLSMFQFHSTNSGQSCYMHQIVKYFHKGWKMFKSGKFCESGKLEVHHLDSNPSNNDKHNLEYVTPLENKLLCHNLAGSFNLSRVNGRDKFMTVRNSVRFIKLRIRTAWATLSRLGFESFIWFSI